MLLAADFTPKSILRNLRRVGADQSLASQSTTGRKETVNIMDTCGATSTNHTRRKRFQNDSRGLSTVEYVIILVLIAIASVAMWKNFGETIGGKIKSSNGSLQKL